MLQSTGAQSKRRSRDSYSNRAYSRTPLYRTRATIRTNDLDTLVHIRDLSPRQHRTARSWKAYSGGSASTKSLSRSITGGGSDCMTVGALRRAVKGHHAGMMANASQQCNRLSEACPGYSYLSSAYCITYGSQACNFRAHGIDCSAGERQVREWCSRRVIEGSTK